MLRSYPRVYLFIWTDDSPKVSPYSGMTCRILAEFGLSGLHHPAEAVRKMAEKILVLVYRSNPRLVRRQLPPDDDVTRRNILYRHLMQEFDRVDVEVRKT